MEIGFYILNTKGHVYMNVFDSKFKAASKLVKVAQNIDRSLILMGKLYYTEELIARLSGTLPKQTLECYKENDAALALAIYERFGIEGLQRLEGDFCVVLWDGQNDYFIGIRDPMGGYPLFWTYQDDSFAFATGLQPLIDLIGRQYLNLNYLAEFLMVPGPVNERSDESCVYEGISRVLPGSFIKFNTRHRHIDRVIYWNWTDKIEYRQYNQIKDVSMEYRALLDEAVHTRMFNPTAAHLSGGMDSTTIALIAREFANTGVTRSPVHTISLIYESLPNLSREKHFVESVLEKPGFVPHRIIGDDILDFDSFLDPPFHDEPFVGLWRTALDRATVNAAANASASVLLTGIGADEMLDIQPFYITDLLRLGHFLTAWQEAKKWALQDNCNAWGILYPFGIANLLATSSWGNVVNRCIRRRHSVLRKHDDWSVSPWINASFAKRHKLKERSKRNALQTYTSSGSTCISFALDSIASRRGDFTRWSVAAPRGLLIAHPFLDTRVLCFCLGVMVSMKPEPEKMKPLLAEATLGLLPDQIRTRRRKGQFNEIYFKGLARNHEYLKGMVQKTQIEEIGMIDKNILVRYLHEAVLGGAHVRQLHRLNLTLCLIKWIGMQEQRNNYRKIPMLSFENHVVPGRLA